MFSRPQAGENSRQHLLLRTDILQKTVVPGLPLPLRQFQSFPYSIMPSNPTQGLE